MKNFKEFLFESGDAWIKQARIDKTSEKTVKDMIKKQAERPKNPKKAFQAEIYTKYGGNAVFVWSFAKNASEAIKEIENLPHFKSFSKRPVQVEVDF
jgi:hypothetical protein